MKYRKKPLEIEAIQFTGTEQSACRMVGEWPEFLYKCRYGRGDKTLTIVTLEGDMVAKEGDWIIKGIEGEFYPCKDSVFKESYELSFDTQKATSGDRTMMTMCECMGYYCPGDCG
jgi:hypothetical protein